MLGNVNLHVMNFLSSIKTFLDHSEFKLKRTHGEHSEIYRNFKNATNHAFDTCFSYRFLYHLRNYVQHCGMPVTGFAPSSCVNDKINKHLICFLVAYCDKDELLEKYKWHKRVFNDFQKLPNQIEISPHIHNMMKCIQGIGITILKNDLPELMKQSGVLYELMDPIIPDKSLLNNLTYPLKIDIPFICESEDMEDSLVYNLEWIPLHLLQIIFYSEDIFI